MQRKELEERLCADGLDRRLLELYATDEAGVRAQKERYRRAAREFDALFGAERDVSLYSAPGRTEIGGNHTDHQRGRVLAAAVELDVIAVASPNAEPVIRIKSEGYEMDTIDLTDLAPCEEETGHAASLIRGVAARLHALGYKLGGFDAYTTSNVLKGSGLSSSAAFEVLVGTILNHLYNGGRIGAVEIAQVGQYAENVYFGKPCGLMDQTASSVGGFVSIDFRNPAKPEVWRIGFDFADSGYALCIVDTGGSHADLTPDYAAVPEEMREVAGLCGAEVLREVDQAEFYRRLPLLREQAGDRAVLRAIHFFTDDERAAEEARALSAGDFPRFLELVRSSGRSSFQYLQNAYSTQNPREQGVPLGMALSEQVLDGLGAWRVHGGGFAGTIQAFVPQGKLAEYRAVLESAFGGGTCHVLKIRPFGGVRVDLQ